jgi:hypothetical protein
MGRNTKRLFYLVDRNKVYLMPAGENQELLNENKLRVVELAKIII